jgi:hypothetical protein
LQHTYLITNIRLLFDITKQNTFSNIKCFNETKIFVRVKNCCRILQLYLHKLLILKTQHIAIHITFRPFYICNFNCITVLLFQSIYLFHFIKFIWHGTIYLLLEICYSYIFIISFNICLKYYIFLRIMSSLTTKY